MRPLRQVVIFVKAPQMGAVKRRVSADIGDFAGWRFYRTETARLIAKLGRLRNCELRLAVTQDRFAHRGRFWHAGIPRIPQGCGDPGADGPRLPEGIHRHLGPRPRSNAPPQSLPRTEQAPHAVPSPVDLANATCSVQTDPTAVCVPS